MEYGGKRKDIFEGSIKVNILFYQHQYPAFGGIETVTTMLANAFVADRNNIAIVSFISKEGTDLLERLDSRVVWHKLPEAEIDSAANIDALRNILDSFNPDKIIFQDSYANIQGVLFKALDLWKDAKNQCSAIEECPAPRISLARRMKPLSPAEILKRIVLFALKPLLLAWRFRYESQRRSILFDRADHYVILSGNYRRSIKALVGHERTGKLRVIPNPISVSAEVVDFAQKKKQVLFVGSLIVAKGVDRLVRIWERIAPRHPDWEFVVVGDGVERSSLESLVDKAGIPRIRFEGFCRDPSPYYKEASLFVMASDFEGWPMVLGEAMHAGCVPVVYDSFAAASDIIEDGVNGRVVRSFSRLQFVDALEELMYIDALRLEMADAACRKISKYSLSAIKRDWYALLSGMGAIIVVEHNAPFYR